MKRRVDILSITRYNRALMNGYGPNLKVKGMKEVKKTSEYTIYQKRNGRHAVKGSNGYVNGEEKAKILLAEGLIKLTEPRPVEEAPAEEAEAEAPAEAEAAEGGEEAEA
jgi:predicted transcriptional regulator